MPTAPDRTSCASESCTTDLLALEAVLSGWQMPAWLEEMLYVEALVWTHCWLDPLTAWAEIERQQAEIDDRCYQIAIMADLLFLDGVMKEGGPERLACYWQDDDPAYRASRTVQWRPKNTQQPDVMDTSSVPWEYVGAARVGETFLGVYTLSVYEQPMLWADVMQEVGKRCSG